MQGRHWINMRILLLNPQLKNWFVNVYVPIGQAYVAASLEKAGHELRMLDFNAGRVSQDDLARQVRWAQVVGIGGLITEYENIVGLSRRVKAIKQDTFLVLGGPMASSMPERMLGETNADAVVLNEGEVSMPVLCHILERNQGLQDVAGIVYRQDGQVVRTAMRGFITDLDRLPFPARHLLDMKPYLQDYLRSTNVAKELRTKVRGTNLISSRGCPFSCVFCSKVPLGSKWRARSAQNMIDEVNLLHEEYGVNELVYNDDTFVLDRKRVFEFCALLERERYKLVWYCNARVNLVDKEMLEAMYAAGCRFIAYGIESGNQEMLDLMRKGITLEKARNAAKWTKEAGICVAGSFMLGMKGETKAFMQDTLRFAKELELDYYGFSFLMPLPCTEVYDKLFDGQVSKYGDWGTYSTINLTKDCSDEELVKIGTQAYRQFSLVHLYGKLYYLNIVLWYRTVKQVLISMKRAQFKRLLAKLLVAFRLKK